MDFSEICQDKLPFKPWLAPKTRRLPGVQPIKEGEWLLRDDAFAAQMAYRDHLIATKRAAVFQHEATSLPAQQEVLATVLAEVSGGESGQRAVTRPDGITVALSGPPLLSAARLVQEDLLIIDMKEEPRLRAAVLCFPASWILAEKFGAGLRAIHGYVDEYTEDMAARVQRMFEMVRPEQPLWRANYFRYKSADLFQPWPAGVAKPGLSEGGFVRVERQTIRKLKETGAIVFGIHTYVFPWDRLEKEEQIAFLKA